MSGADLSADDIANGVFHALYPECPAFPGIPNGCDTQICDCFNADQLPAKVKELVTRVRELEDALRPFVQMSYPPDKQVWIDCRNWARAALTQGDA